MTTIQALATFTAFCALVWPLNPMRLMLAVTLAACVIFPAIQGV